MERVPRNRKQKLSSECNFCLNRMLHVNWIKEQNIDGNSAKKRQKNLIGLVLLFLVLVVSDVGC